MRIVNLRQAKANFSRLVSQVSMGEEVVIAKAGKPMARLVPLKKAVPERKPGFLKGKIRIAPDFDAPLPEEIPTDFVRGK